MLVQAILSFVQQTCIIFSLLDPGFGKHGEGTWGMWEQLTMSKSLGLLIFID